MSNASSGLRMHKDQPTRFSDHRIIVTKWMNIQQASDQGATSTALVCDSIIYQIIAIN